MTIGTTNPSRKLGIPLEAGADMLPEVFVIFLGGDCMQVSSYAGSPAEYKSFFVGLG